MNIRRMVNDRKKSKRSKRGNKVSTRIFLLQLIFLVTVIYETRSLIFLIHRSPRRTQTTSPSRSSNRTDPPNSSQTVRSSLSLALQLNRLGLVICLANLINLSNTLDQEVQVREFNNYILHNVVTTIYRYSVVHNDPQYK